MQQDKHYAAMAHYIVYDGHLQDSYELFWSNFVKSTQWYGMPWGLQALWWFGLKKFDLFKFERVNAGEYAFLAMLMPLRSSSPPRYVYKIYE